MTIEIQINEFGLSNVLSCPKSTKNLYVISNSSNNYDSITQKAKLCQNCKN